MSYCCARLVRRFTILYACIIVSVSIGWINIACAQTDKYSTILVHFPPFQYDPTLAEKKLGLTVELWDLANPQDAHRQNRQYYPPSRISKMASQGELEVFSPVQFIIKRYDLLKHYRCTGNVLQIIPVLYQNLNLEPIEIKNLKSELIGKSILLPQESKLFFQSLIPQGNQVVTMIQPRNMAKMFMAQRYPYMLDFQERAEVSLKQDKASLFAIKRYVLIQLKTSVCVTKQRPDLFADVMQQYWNFRKMKDTPEAHRLEDKYDFKLNWGPDEDELTPDRLQNISPNNH
ncbi:hypothetical protein HQQ94_17725 [Shewanella sp. VB17]|uniref:hypothetical protein n=1 Tax=Shewanella sp. VB17 TaxID=2739432 RepID=UPI001566F4C2|nr:hypothetical protein [Shewanella sp. VB17]NRD75021.1 hypothetical protein [Shewanella sp. VB17]